ncbi:agouti-signaling protein 2b [Sphaeramia orbicularis]|uniref:Agouti-signaling protein-like n=1 Tax=Sphaeramia orbicularis TaxID=375764 RepID=A0A673AHN2_9TELE|nr:agouti-signaling protein-like [Sphaeramia orbicularis]
MSDVCVFFLVDVSLSPLSSADPHSKNMRGKHLLCFLLLSFSLSWAENVRKDGRNTENDTVWSQGKTRRLFARRKTAPPQESRTTKLRTDPMTPARRCGRLMESCSSHVPCCDPCASCRCRLFNTICHCWRMNPLCLKKT